MRCEGSPVLPPCAARGPSDTSGCRMRARSSDSSAEMSILARTDSATANTTQMLLGQRPCHYEPRHAVATCTETTWSRQLVDLSWIPEQTRTPCMIIARDPNLTRSMGPEDGPHQLYGVGHRTADPRAQHPPLRDVCSAQLGMAAPQVRLRMILVQPLILHLFLQSHRTAWRRQRPAQQPPTPHAPWEPETPPEPPSGTLETMLTQSSDFTPNPDCRLHT